MEYDGMGIRFDLRTKLLSRNSASSFLMKIRAAKSFNLKNSERVKKRNLWSCE